MIIKKILIAGFGCFRNRTFEFDEGLNVVYGGNEAGKSTLQKFIEGVFFGFIKPYAKGRHYLPEQDRYRPWDGGVYAGRIDYVCGKRSYTLQRRFDTENASVKLYDTLTGEDLTDMLAYDPAAKLPAANLHMDMNSTLYKNTVCISQAESTTGPELAAEIGELLVNTGASLAADISYKAALEYLDKKKEAIGTARQAKTPHGALCAALAALQKEKQRAVKAAADNRSLYMQIKTVQSELARAGEAKSGLARENDKRRLREELEKYSRYKIMAADIKQLKAQLDESDVISEEDYENYNRLSALKAECENGIKENEAGLDNARRRLDELSGADGAAFDTDSAAAAEERYKDRVLLESTQEKLAEIAGQRREAPPANIETEYGRLAGREKLFSLIGTAAMVTAAASFVCGYVFDNLFYYAGAALAAIGLGALLLWGHTASRRADAEAQHDKFDTLSTRLAGTETVCRLDMERLKSKYDCADENELADKLADARPLFAADALELEKAAVTDRIGKLEKDVAAAENKAAGYAAQMKELLKSSGAAGEEDIKTAIAKSRGRAALRERLENEMKSISELLRETTPAALKDAAMAAVAAGITVDDDTAAAGTTDGEDINENITALSAKLAALETQAAENEKNSRPLNEIEEEIAAYTEKKQQYEFTLNAIAMAKATIEDISREIHTGFAEEFNGYVSEMTSRITRGKYCDVRVNERMEVTVCDGATGLFIPAESLSSGTVDQLYLAVRFAIADLIVKDKTVPFILDDCFLQYDDKRLAGALVFLSEVARERQIILFTCRRSEKDKLDTAKIPYQLIKL